MSVILVEVLGIMQGNVWISEVTPAVIDKAETNTSVNPEVNKLLQELM